MRQILREYRRTFRGPHASSAWFATIEAWIVVGVLVWAIVSLLQAETTRSQILFATLVLALAVTIALIKVWLFILMARNALEDRLAQLEEQMQRGA